MSANPAAGTSTKVELVPGVELVLVFCPPGSFVMGGVPAPGCGESEFFTIPHAVTLTKGFWIGKYPVTQEQFEALIGLNPSERKDPQLPVTDVNWKMCVWFARKANEFLSMPCFRLPTEAEWEYACRATTTGDVSGNGDINDMGWYAGNSERRVRPVGEKNPNHWGLHDMQGEVMEWCQDGYQRYPETHVTDPISSPHEYQHVLRGGCFNSTASRCLSYSRIAGSSPAPGIGFRIAADAASQPSTGALY